MTSDIHSKYTVLLADPPWAYNDACNAGNRGAVHKYPCLRYHELCELQVNGIPVSELAADNSALFLWATAPMLPLALCLTHAWNFKYKTVAFTWAKTCRNSDKWFMGMGNWTRSNAEFCLLAVRGHPKRVDAGVRSLVVASRREHSQKPDEVRVLIERLFGDVPRIELFARGKALPGWTFWGDEVLP